MWDCDLGGILIQICTGVSKVKFKHFSVGSTWCVFVFKCCFSYQCLMYLRVTTVTIACISPAVETEVVTPSIWWCVFSNSWLFLSVRHVFHCWSVLPSPWQLFPSKTPRYTCTSKRSTSLRTVAETLSKSLSYCVTLASHCLKKKFYMHCQ